MSSTPPEDRDRLKALDEKLNAHRAAAERQQRRGMDKHSASALGLAWRLSTEIVATLVVGGLLGYGADQLFNTTPWGLLIGLGFGFAAGLRNVIRLTAALQKQFPPDGTS